MAVNRRLVIPRVDGGLEFLYQNDLVQLVRLLCEITVMLIRPTERRCPIMPRVRPGPNATRVVAKRFISAVIDKAECQSNYKRQKEFVFVQKHPR